MQLSISSTDLQERELWGTRQIETPYKECPDYRIVTCHYLSSLNLYSKNALDTPWQEDPSLFLVDDVIEKIEGNIVWYWRRWANMPQTFSRTTTLAYAYPKFVNTDGEIRGTHTIQTQGREEWVFFHTDDPFGKVNALNEIPLLQLFKPRVNGQYEADAVFDDDGAGNQTVPNLSQYSQWINDRYELVAKESELECVIGNIFARKTIYVRAK